MSIVIYNCIGYIAGMLNIHIVSNGGRKGEGIVRHPKGRLNSWVISNFSIGTNSNWIIKAVNHCSKSHIAILGNEDVAIDSSIRSNMGRLGYGKSELFDIKNVSMSINWL